MQKRIKRKPASRLAFNRGRSTRVLNTMLGPAEVLAKFFFSFFWVISLRGEVRDWDICCVSPSEDSPQSSVLGPGQSCFNGSSYGSEERGTLLYAGIDSRFQMLAGV